MDLELIRCLLLEMQTWICRHMGKLCQPTVRFRRKLLKLDGALVREGDRHTSAAQMLSTHTARKPF